ncbi:MAG: metallophosphoesterase [Planctomycetaceae bacterium]|nr:metallophosphoesterase [Planctomycetaceae bacterium]
MKEFCRTLLLICSLAVLQVVLPLNTFGKDESRAVQRDWAAFPAIIEMDAPRELYAVGDVHGDYDRLVTLLIAAKLIGPGAASPAEAKWLGGSAVLICTGDLIDKGKHSLKVVALFRALQASASQAGGKVLVTMGNHEAEFLAAGDTDDKAEEFLKELEKHGLDPNTVAAGQDAQDVGKFLRSLPFAVRAGDWFFAHACNTDGRTLNALRIKLQDDVKSLGFGSPILSADDSLLEARLHPIPWWEREGDAPKESAGRLREFAQALGIKHFVMGHQPGAVKFSDGTKRKKGALFQKFDGLMFLIDTGMSEAIDYSTGTILHITILNGKASAKAIGVDGIPQELWNENSN